MVTVINFMLCVFYHNFKKKERNQQIPLPGGTTVHFLCGLRFSLCSRVGRGKQCVLTFRSRIRSQRNVLAVNKCRSPLLFSSAAAGCEMDPDLLHLSLLRGI